MVLLYVHNVREAAGSTACSVTLGKEGITARQVVSREKRRMRSRCLGWVMSAWSDKACGRSIQIHMGPRVKARETHC